MEGKRSASRSQVLRDWATAELLVRRLSGECVYREAQCGLLPRVEHPAILVQAAMQEVFRPHSPLEIFSDEQPSFKPQRQEEEGLIPIDEVLGRYDHKSRSIHIFVKNVTHFASAALKCDVRSLEYIVRIHEYAHALLHTGLSWTDEPLLMHTYPSVNKPIGNPFCGTVRWLSDLSNRKSMSLLRK
jgi:hypothetical protein